MRPQDHLKRDATANLLIFYGNSGVWWRLLHNSAIVAYQINPLPPKPVGAFVP